MSDKRLRLRTDSSIEVAYVDDCDTWETDIPALALDEHRVTFPDPQTVQRAIAELERLERLMVARVAARRIVVAGEPT